MESNKTYKNSKTGTTFKVGLSTTKITQIGKSPIYVNTSSIGSHKHL
jgi:hypothetical protein